MTDFVGKIVFFDGTLELMWSHLATPNLLPNVVAQMTLPKFGSTFSARWRWVLPKAQLKFGFGSAYSQVSGTGLGVTKKKKEPALRMTKLKGHFIAIKTTLILVLHSRHSARRTLLPFQQEHCQEQNFKIQLRPQLSNAYDPTFIKRLLVPLYPKFFKSCVNRLFVSTFLFLLKLEFPILIRKVRNFRTPLL